MKSVLALVKKHPTSIIIYLVYAFLWYNTLKPVEKQMTDGGLLGLAGLFTAFVFITVSLIKAIRTKDQYYYWLILFIIAPVVIAFII